MPDHSPSASHSVRVLRRFFDRRLQTTDGAPAESVNHSGPSPQVVTHLTQRALVRASLQAALRSPHSLPATGSSWKQHLMRAALHELHAFDH